MDDVVGRDAPALEGVGPAPPEELFEGGHRCETQFGGALGLRQGPAFTSDERQRIEELIHSHLVNAARAISARAAAEMRSVPLERYHEISDRLDHGRLLSKRGRIMGAEAVAEIKTMSFFDYAKASFGADCRLSDEESVGHEQICLRLVRPGRREDVGSLHADAWFWEHHGWIPPAGAHRTKMWLGICVDATRNGLLVAPGSHRQHAPYRASERGGRVSFEPDFDVGALELRRFDGRPGEPILFNYRMLHAGSLNRAPTTRVSIELTLLYKGDDRSESGRPLRKGRASSGTASRASRKASPPPRRC
jgi:hypothetical protein